MKTQRFPFTAPLNNGKRRFADFSHSAATFRENRPALAYGGGGKSENGIATVAIECLLNHGETK